MSASRLLLVTLCSGIVLGCGRENPEPSAADDQQSIASRASAPPTADEWVGRWIGPEGTYLDIAGANGVYEVTVKDLDRARTFSGSAVGDHIEFQRDGIKEYPRATDGNDTGMKWLAGKTDCLTVKPGEGYCRD
jgi:hypothetical protein